MVQMKLRGKKVGDTLEMEAKWALLSGKLAKGTMDGKLVDGKATVVVTPKGSTKPVTVTAYYPSTIMEHNKLGFSARKGEHQLFNYEGKLKW